MLFDDFTLPSSLQQRCRTAEFKSALFVWPAGYPAEVFGELGDLRFSFGRSSILF